MKITYYIAAISVLLVVFATILFFLFTRTELPLEIVQGNPNDPFSSGPIVDFNGTKPIVKPNTNLNTSTTTVSVVLTDLRRFDVRNFLNDPDVLPLIDNVTGEEYFSLGSIPYVMGITNVSDDFLATLPDSLTRKYEIQYFPSAGTFIIFIYSEPIGEVRKTMTEDVATRLGVSTGEVCNILATVRVTASANSFYAGRNLGFAGCRNADKLPGD